MAINIQQAISLPSAHLREYVNHYWLSCNNSDEVHSIMPDGSVDIVIKISGGLSQSLIYGSTTTRKDIPLELGSHYLGISFKAGKSRHFINTAASELTNTNESSKGLLKFDFLDAHEYIGSNDLFLKLNNILEQHVRRYQPINSRIDNIVHNIESSNGMSPIAEYSSIFCKSTRHFERIFKETVGISAKLYSQIVRFRCASTLISRTNLSLSCIATTLGYTDQSHMSREFRRFANTTPAAYARNHVVFLQDQSYRHIDNSNS